jgi:antitoxin component of MazEF toxin-antitoxin module
MEEVITKIKRWGNSYGVLLPKSIINNELKENVEVKITVRPNTKLTVKDLFNLSKRHPVKTNKHTEEIMRETDYELYGIKK